MDGQDVRELVLACDLVDDEAAAVRRAEMAAESKARKAREAAELGGEGAMYLGEPRQGRHSCPASKQGSRRWSVWTTPLPRETKRGADTQLWPNAG